MPKVNGKVLKTSIKDGQMYALIQLNEKIPAAGESISVKWGSVRTNNQNSLYWLFLNWCITEGGLKDHGHFFAETLHDNLKAHLLGKGIKLNPEEVTTTDLTKSEFGEYFQRVDAFIQEFFSVDTSAFWDEHKEKAA